MFRTSARAIVAAATIAVGTVVPTIFAVPAAHANPGDHPNDQCLSTGVAAVAWLVLYVPYPLLVFPGVAGPGCTTKEVDCNSEDCNLIAAAKASAKAGTGVGAHVKIQALGYAPDGSTFWEDLRNSDDSTVAGSCSTSALACQATTPSVVVKNGFPGAPLFGDSFRAVCTWDQPPLPSIGITLQDVCQIAASPSIT